MRGLSKVAVLIGTVALSTGCLRYNVQHLSSDALGGRNNNSAGGIAARDYVIDVLDQFTVGSIQGQTGAAAYKQTFPTGVNPTWPITRSSALSQSGCWSRRTAVFSLPRFTACRLSYCRRGSLITTEQGTQSIGQVGPTAYTAG
jgi:hypothetical protein